MVRQALAELDQWEVQAKFMLIPHTDSHDKSVFLVKDFKEILNKVKKNLLNLEIYKYNYNFMVLDW